MRALVDSLRMDGEIGGERGDGVGVEVRCGS